jgi:hypothetical protein
VVEVVIPIPITEEELPEAVALAAVDKFLTVLRFTLSAPLLTQIPLTTEFVFAEEGTYPLPIFATVLLLMVPVTAPPLHKIPVIMGAVVPVEAVV